MRISNVRVVLLSAPIPPERRWTSDFGTNTKQDVAIVIVETDAGLTGYGEAKGTPAVMKVLVEDVLAPQLVGEDPTRVEFLWEKLYSASRLPLALAHGRPYHRAGSRGETLHAISRWTWRCGICPPRARACRSTACWAAACASACRPTPAAGGGPPHAPPPEGPGL